MYICKNYSEMEQKSEIVLYQPEGSVSLEVRLENETYGWHNNRYLNCSEQGGKL